MEKIRENLFIIRYRINETRDIKIKEFTNAREAYDFYHGLENCQFKAMILHTKVVLTIPLLYEGSGPVGKK